MFSGKVRGQRSFCVGRTLLRHRYGHPDFYPRPSKDLVDTPYVARVETKIILF